jgi:hypothetical protein
MKVSLYDAANANLNVLHVRKSARLWFMPEVHFPKVGIRWIFSFIKLTLTVNRCSIRASDGDCPALFHFLSECLNLLLPFNYDLVLSGEQPRKAPNQT